MFVTSEKIWCLTFPLVGIPNFFEEPHKKSCGWSVLEELGCNEHVQIFHTDRGLLGSVDRPAVMRVVGSRDTRMVSNSSRV